MKNDRLFQIVYLLLEQPRLSAPQLAQRLEVSVRTVYRDIETLAQAGVPVYAERGHGGGVRLMEGYRLDRSLLTDSERRRLTMALETLRAAAPEEDERLADKLGALFGQSGEKWLEVDFSRWGGYAPEKDRFETIRRAILDKRKLEITYCGAFSEVSYRRVRPARLVFKGRDWYVSAWCDRSDGWRLFKLTRILSLAETGECFAPLPPPPPTELPMPPSPNERNVVLRFGPDAAYRALDEFGPEYLTREQDGSMTARITMSPEEWLCPYLLSFGTALTVISPPELRERLRLEAEKIVEHYQT